MIFNLIKVEKEIKLNKQNTYLAYKEIIE